MATFLLIHGSMHGGWCWKRVVPLLRAAGHDVYAPSLTGLGERAHLARPDVTLATHVQDIVGLLEAEDLEGVVLVGHSYAGLPITGAAHRAPERLRHLVYLDAYIPEHGQSGMDLYARGNPAAVEAREAAVRERGDGWMIPLDPALAERAEVFGVTAEADRRWLVSKLRPQPYGTYTEPLSANNPAAAALPRTLIACIGTAQSPRQSFPDARRRAETEPGWQLRELATGHDAMLTAPAELARILIEVI